MKRWIVLLSTGLDAKATHAYGSFEDPELAEQFAAFMTKEVDPARCVRLVDPLDELLAFRENYLAPKAQETRPEYWPPRPGSVWQDRTNSRWVCASAGYLVCLARPADDAPEEIWRVYGPMTFVRDIEPTEEEAPF